MFDVVVAGGSVAGASTAIELGRRGLRVALVERNAFPRFKPCGEGLLPQGVRALESAGLRFPGVPLRGIRYVSPGGVVAEADFPDGGGLVVRRDRFDAFLFEAAAATPNVQAFRETSYDPVRFPARWVVAADGLHSAFHRDRAFRVAAPAAHRVGFSTHVRGLHVLSDRVEVVLHDRGEVYLAPSAPGEALVACLCRGDAVPAGRSNEERVATLLGSLPALRGRVAGLEFTTPCLSCAPLGLRVDPVAAGNVLLVGDASGAPDPVTGEGMSLAILSARAAADAIVRGRPDDYAAERRRLGRASEWLGGWILAAARFPRVADRVVGSLRDRPELFRRLLDVATGRVGADEVSVLELARLVL